MREAAEFVKEADRLYREYIAKYPPGTLAYVRFLQEQNRIDEAFELCDSSWNTIANEDVAKACVDLREAASWNRPNFNA